MSKRLSVIFLLLRIEGEWLFLAPPLFANIRFFFGFPIYFERKNTIIFISADYFVFMAGSIGKCKFSEKFEELLFWRGESEFFSWPQVQFIPNRSLGLVVFRIFRRMNFVCLLMSDSKLLRIKNKQKASYKNRKTARSNLKNPHTT